MENKILTYYEWFNTILKQKFSTNNIGKVILNVEPDKTMEELYNEYVAKYRDQKIKDLGL